MQLKRSHVIFFLGMDCCTILLSNASFTKITIYVNLMDHLECLFHENNNICESDGPIISRQGHTCNRFFFLISFENCYNGLKCINNIISLVYLITKTNIWKKSYQHVIHILFNHTFYPTNLADMLSVIVHLLS